jgi:hypothetical protein
LLPVSRTSSCGVRPENERAVKTYLRVGCQPVDEQLAAGWTEPQPIGYVWLQ